MRTKQHIHMENITFWFVFGGFGDVNLIGSFISTNMNNEFDLTNGRTDGRGGRRTDRGTNMK